MENENFSNKEKEKPYNVSKKRKMQKVMTLRDSDESMLRRIDMNSGMMTIVNSNETNDNQVSKIITDDSSKNSSDTKTVSELESSDEIECITLSSDEEESEENNDIMKEEEDDDIPGYYRMLANDRGFVHYGNKPKFCHIFYNKDGTCRTYTTFIDIHDQLQHDIENHTDYVPVEQKPLILIPHGYGDPAYYRWTDGDKKKPVPYGVKLIKSEENKSPKVCHQIAETRGKKRKIETLTRLEPLQPNNACTTLISTTEPTIMSTNVNHETYQHLKRNEDEIVDYALKIDGLSTVYGNIPDVLLGKEANVIPAKVPKLTGISAVRKGYHKYRYKV